MRPTLLARLLLALVVAPAQAAAQSWAFEAGGQLTIASPTTSDETDLGFGVRVAVRVLPLIGVEAELDAYPDDLSGNGGRVPFSAGRIEALFGATVGPRLGRIRPFARVRPGVLRYQEAAGPVVCVAIFPPPLSCQLAAGQTLFAVDVGGGVEVDLSRRGFMRIDVGDRLVRYPAPASTAHEMRVAIGGGVRFR
jgi:hypothetical protein